MGLTPGTAATVQEDLPQIQDERRPKASLVLSGQAALRDCCARSLCPDVAELPLLMSQLCELSKAIPTCLC